MDLPFSSLNLFLNCSFKLTNFISFKMILEGGGGIEEAKVLSILFLSYILLSLRYSILILAI